jgi:hypothetical protein
MADFSRPERVAQYSLDMLQSNNGTLIPMIRKSEWRLWFSAFTLHASGRGFCDLDFSTPSGV